MPMFGDNADDAVYVSPDETLESLIEWYDEREDKAGFADALRHIRRALAIRSTDLVGADRMVGARVTFVDGDGDPHRAIVLEPEVADLVGPCYDPRRDEMVDPSEYPLGTVQLIRGDGWEFGGDFDGFFDRVQSDHPGRGLRAETSVTPASSVDDTYCYFAGWEWFDRNYDGD